VKISLPRKFSRTFCALVRAHDGCRHGKTYRHGDQDEEAPRARAADKRQWIQAYGALCLSVQRAQEPSRAAPDPYVSDQQCRRDKWRSAAESTAPALDHKK
jgi:hypothetical protein